MSDLDNLPLPELVREAPMHDKLDGARFHKDAKTGAPYLLMEDLDEGKIRLIKINRLKAKNGFDDWLYLVIADALNAAAVDEKVLVVVITGEGEFFSSGADLRAEMEGGQGIKTGRGSTFDPVGVFMRTLLRFPKPLIAAVNGPAIGVGCTMLPHCDIVYAADSAYFLTPFSRIAVVPEYGSSLTFPRILGKSVANEMLLFGRQLPASRAYERGFVSAIYPQKGFLDRVLSEVRQGLVYPLLDKTLPLFKHMLRKWEIDYMERLVIYELAKLDARGEAGEIAEAALEFLQKTMGKKSSL